MIQKNTQIHTGNTIKYHKATGPLRKSENGWGMDNRNLGNNFAVNTNAIGNINERYARILNRVFIRLWNYQIILSN